MKKRIPVIVYEELKTHKDLDKVIDKKFTRLKWVEGVPYLISIVGGNR